MFREKLSMLFAALSLVFVLGGDAFGTATSSAQSATPVAAGPPVHDHVARGGLRELKGIPGSWQLYAVDRSSAA